MAGRVKSSAVTLGKTHSEARLVTGDGGQRVEEGPERPWVLDLDLVLVVASTLCLQRWRSSAYSVQSGRSIWLTAQRSQRRRGGTDPTALAKLRWLGPIP